MTAFALPWFEDENPRDLARWGMAATAVLGIHAALISGYLLWHHPDEIGDDTSAVTVELEPIDSTADVTQRDIAPAPEEMIEQKPVPEAEKQPDEPKVEEPPPTETTMPDIVAPEPKPPEKLEEKDRRPRKRRRASKAVHRMSRRHGRPAW